jgi:acetyl esterase
LPLDPRVKRFLEVLAAGNSAGSLDPSVAERRAQITELMRLGGPAPPIGRAETLSIPGSAGPLNARLYSPVEARAGLLPGMLYLHGGGLVAGDLDTHAAIAQSLAHFGACRVLALDYRLAPEHPFPAALDDACAAVKILRARAADYGIDGARLAICGDSAGGTLAAAACQAAAHAQEPPLALQVLLCPILDYSRRSGSRAEFASGYLLEQATSITTCAIAFPAVPMRWTRACRRCARRTCPASRPPSSTRRNSIRCGMRAENISSVSPTPEWACPILATWV